MSGHVMAQKQGYFWYFGKNAGLDFSKFDPVPLTNSQMDAPEGVAAVSDTTGRLLFYTDGVNIWDSTHVRINSTPLSGDPSSTQSATIVPDPRNPDQYFVFTTKPFSTGSEANYGGNYYIIRIRHGETGTIIYDYSAATGSKGLLENSTEKFVAVPFTYSGNKTGYWFLMHEFNSNRFMKVRLDSIWHDPEFQSIGSVHANDSTDNGSNRGAAGQMKVNDVGSRLAVAVEGSKFFEIFRFNKSSGMLSNPLQIPAGDLDDKFAFKLGAYGVEFSPTGIYGYDPSSQNYLYGTTSSGGQIYQWDLSLDYDRTQFIKNGQILYSNPEIQCGALQIAPNGKIYIAFNGQDFLGVINSPMRPDCKFEPSGARLVNNDNGLGGTSGLGLPPATVVKIPEPFYFENLCLGDETLFYITDQTSITPNMPRAWVFTKLGPGGSNVTKTTTANEYRYRFLTAGNYRVRLTVFKSGSPVTYQRELTINPLPNVKLAAQDRVILCLGSSMDLDAGSGAFYEWEDVRIKQRYRTITNDSVYPLLEYRVKVTDYHGCVGWDTIWVEKKFPPVVESTSSMKAFCGNKDGSATVIPNGNIQNYNYQWKGYPEVNANTLTGINGGDYIIKVVSKSTLCNVTDTIHVEELGGSSVKILHDPVVACPGVPINLTVTGADEYSWTAPSGYSGGGISLDTTTVFSGRAISRDAGRECPTNFTDTIRVFPKNIPYLVSDTSSYEGDTITIDGGREFTDWNWSVGQTGRFARITKPTDSLVLTVRDTNGCSFSAKMSVHFLPCPDVNLGRDTAVCSKDPITLRGDDGTGESYLWSRLEESGPVNLGTADSLVADRTGDYVLSVTKNGCIKSDTVHVQLNDPYSLKVVSVLTKNVTCHGAGNGSIEVFAEGDGRDFYYSIDGGISFQDNQGKFTNIQPGSGYVIQVLADSVCSTIWPVPVTISQPDTLIVKYCALAPSCSGCTDGQISVDQITGGTPPYKVQLDDTDRDKLILNLGPGDYSLTVTDAQLCKVQILVSLKEGTRPEIVSSRVMPVCAGTPVTLRVTNSLQAEWINPAGSYNLEITVNPTEPTTYRVKSINPDPDGFACETLLEFRVDVFPFVKPELGDGIRSCKGDTIPLTVNGDYLSYDWSNGMNGRTIKLFESVDSLILTVMDANSCYQKDTVPVTFYDRPPVDLGRDTSVCSKDPITLFGGTGDSYLWSRLENSQEVTLGTGQTMSIDRTGDYRLTITKDGCSRSDTVHVQLNDPGSLKVDTVLFRDISCHGAGDGSIRVVASGDGRIFYYSINGKDFLTNNGVFENLRPGQAYTVSVMADSVCAVPWKRPVILTEPDSLAVKLCTLQPSCAGCADGNIRVARITGGTPPYNILLNGELADSAMFGLAPGLYSVTVADAHNCSLVVPVELVPGPHPKITGSVNYPVCTGTPVTLTLTGFNRIEWINPAWGGDKARIVVNPYTSTIYRVRSVKTDADNFVCDTILEYPIDIFPFVSPTLKDTVKACAGDTVDLDAGPGYRFPEWNNGVRDRYNRLFDTFDPLILSVMDDNGCILKDTVSVLFNPRPEVDLGEDKSACSSTPFILSGGTGDFYTWSTGDTTSTIQVTSSGTFWLEINTKDCYASDTVTIRLVDPELFEIDTVVIKDNSCFGGEAGSIGIFMKNPGIYQYSIDNGETYQDSSLFENLPSGGYGIKVSEESTCYMEYPAPVNIGQPDSIQIKYALRSPTCETCADGTLTLTIKGGVGPYTITLDGRPVELVTGSLGVGTYTIAVTDSNSCTKTVEFKLEFLRVIPNVITANGDGFNDKWKIPMLQYYPGAVVRVFTISGKKVFESEAGYPDPWDGKDSGNELPMGTYYYLIDLGPGVKQLTGYLTILR